MPGFSVHHQVQELALTHAHQVSDAIQPLILYHLLLLPPSIFPSVRVFSNESVLPTSGGRSIGGSASTSVLPMNIQDWFPLELTGLISLQPKGLSRVFSSTTVQKHQFFGPLLSLWSNSHPYMTTGKTTALTRQTFVGKVMSLLFNMPSRLVIVSLPRRRHLLISWLQSPSAVIFEPKKIKSVTVAIVSPSVCQEVMGPNAMILVFRMLSFKPSFLPSFFTFIKRLFSSSSLSAIRVVSSAYLRLLIFLLTILIPAWASSSPEFLMMYSACKLKKQGDNIQPWCTPCPMWIQSVVPCLVLKCCFLTCTQISQETGKVVWYSHLLNFPQFVMIHTVKGFDVVNTAEVDIFLEFSCFF